MKKLFSLVLILVAAVELHAVVSWTFLPPPTVILSPPSSVLSGQSYTIAVAESHSSCVSVLAYIYKNGTQVAMHGNGGGLGSYTTTTSYTSSDTGAQTIAYRAEGWSATPLGGQQIGWVAYCVDRHYYADAHDLCAQYDQLY